MNTDQVEKVVNCYYRLYGECAKGRLTVKDEACVYCLENALDEFASLSAVTIFRRSDRTTFFLLIDALQRIVTIMKTDRSRCSVCGDYDLMKGWVLSYHELYCGRCAIKKLVESSS